MRLSHKSVGSVLVVRPLGARLDSSSAQDFRRKLIDGVNGAHTDLVLDLSKVSYIDDLGISAIVAALDQLKDKGKLIIVAGDHSPVDVPDKNIYYSRLENYARQHLNVKSIEYRWTSTDSITDDRLPLIGMTSQESVYVATGFGFWGMTNGTTAAMVITDLITGKENEFVNLFNPLRFI